MTSFNFLCHQIYGTVTSVIRSENREPEAQKILMFVSKTMPNNAVIHKFEYCDITICRFIAELVQMYMHSHRPYVLAELKQQIV